MAYNNQLIIPALDHPKECSLCPLDKISVGYAPPEGTGNNGVAIVGEKLGTTEAQEGTPFHPSGAAGAILERTFKKLQVNRQSFKIINSIQCCPPNNALLGTPYEWGSLEHCSAHRNKVLLNMPESGPGYKRKVILAMGEIASRTLTGLWGKFDMIRGYPEETPFGLVYPTYNPAKLIAGREAKLIGVFRHDVEEAIKLAKDGWAAPEVNYQTDPTLADAEAFYEAVKRHSGILTFDIENDWPMNPDQILSVQFSLNKNTGIFLPWNDTFIPVIKAILATEIEKWSYNGWKHDAPLLKKWGCVINGFHGDSFWLFHHIEPDLTTEDTEEGSGLSSRQGLQYAGSMFGFWRRWKHLGTGSKIYGIVDVDVLQYIVPAMIEKAKKEGLWDSFHSHIVRYYPVIEAVTRRGIPVNEARRIEVGKQVDADLVVAESAIQEAYPQQLRNLKPKAGLTRAPKFDGKRYRQSEEKTEWFDKDKKHPDLSTWRPMELRNFKGLKVKQSVECDCFQTQLVSKTGKALKKPRKVWPKDCPKCLGKKKVTTFLDEQQRWVCVLPFKPSKDQIVKYMKSVGHKVPKKRGRGGGDTTEFKELEKLAEKYKNDPKGSGNLYTKIVSYRKLGKIKSTYIDGWKPGSDGRVHGELLMATATGQLNGINPNILNPPRPENPLAVLFNSMVQAPPGRVFVSLDYSSYHGATLAALSGDEVYYKVAVQAGDAHSFLASHLVGEPLDSSVELSVLKAQLKDIKSRYALVRSMKAKPANLGWGFGLKGPGLYSRYPEFFPGEETLVASIKINKFLTDFAREKALKAAGVEQATGVMNLLDKLYWKVADFRRQQAQLAASQDRILSPTNHHRRFYSVYAWRQVLNDSGQFEWVRNDGEDMEDVFAYAPANTAHCNFREVQIRLDDMGVLEKYWFYLPFHDSLMFCPLEKEVDELITVAQYEMTKPIKELKHSVLCPDGLVVGVDVKVGKSWDSMKEYKIGN